MADSQKYVATNVFDINNPNVLNGYINSSGYYVPYATNGTLYVPITAGTSYTVSGIIRASQSIVVRIATFTAIPSTQTPSVNLYTLNQGDSITITAGNNENYLFVMFCGDSDYNAYGSVQAALTANCANLHIDTYSWQHSLRKLTTATEAIENPLYSDGTAITAYTIKGNTVQNGTPTPSNPVPVVGVGELETTGEHSGEYKIPISSGGQTIDIYIGDLPLLKSLDGTAVDEISNGTLTRRVDSDGSVLPAPITTQITMPSIPTTDGVNSITVDTTVQPSEFSATWTGWHDANVKEWDGSDWQ